MFNPNYPNFQSFRPNSSYDYLGYDNRFQNPNFNSQPYPQNNPQQGAPTNIIFVSGMEEAKSFQLRPDSSYLLMDSENSKFYVKTTDSLGIAKISCYVFAEEQVLPQEQSQTAGAPQVDTTRLVGDLNILQDKVGSLETKLYNLSVKLGEAE